MAALRNVWNYDISRSPLKIKKTYYYALQLSRYTELYSIGARTCYGSDIAYSECRNKNKEETITRLSTFKLWIAPP
mgnify:CR=1 FL=1